MQELFGQSSFDNERLIIDQSIKEARGHQIPWKSGPPPRSDVFAFRTPELFTPEEALAIDKDIDEGLKNGLKSVRKILPCAWHVVQFDSRTNSGSLTTQDQ